MWFLFQNMEYSKSSSIKYIKAVGTYDESEIAESMDRMTDAHYGEVHSGGTVTVQESQGCPVLSSTWPHLNSDVGLEKGEY